MSPLWPRPANSLCNRLWHSISVMSCCLHVANDDNDDNDAKVRKSPESLCIVVCCQKSVTCSSQKDESQLFAVTCVVVDIV